MAKKDVFTILCMLCTVLLALLILGGVFFAPGWLDAYCSATGRPQGIVPGVLRTFYFAAPPTVCGLCLLAAVLYNILRGRIFDRKNVILLRSIAWCAALASVSCAVFGYYYLPFLLCAAAGLFISLILAVLARLFFAAAALKDDSDLTI